MCVCLLHGTASRLLDRYDIKAHHQTRLSGTEVGLPFRLEAGVHSTNGSLLPISE